MAGDAGLSAGLRKRWSALGRAKWQVGLEITRMAWGNDAWTENNRGQAKALAKARAAYAGDRAGARVPELVGAGAGMVSEQIVGKDLAVDRAETERMRSEVDRLGFSVLDPHYPAGLIDEIRAGYEKYIDQEDETADMGPIDPEVVRYVIDPASKVPQLRQLLTPQILDVLDEFYGGRWQIGHVRMWRIEHLTPEQHKSLHYGNLWHCDRHPTNTIKLFVQITENVTDESGAFRLHPIPSTRRIMRTGYLGTGRAVGLARRALDHPKRVVLFTVPAGTTAFVNTERCLHRAGVPPQGMTRGMVQLTFRPAPQPRVPGSDPFEGLELDPNVGKGKVV
jgi:hypothetical protein